MMLRNKFGVVGCLFFVATLWSFNASAFKISQAYNFKCDIYVDSQYGEGINKTMGSFLSIKYNKDIKSFQCVYHVSDSLETIYTIEDVQIRGDRAEYVLHGFFGEYNGQMLLIPSDDIPDIVLVEIYCKEDKDKTRELVLIDPNSTIQHAK